MSSIWAKGSMLDDCVCVISFDMITPNWWKEKVMVYYYFIIIKENNIFF